MEDGHSKTVEEVLSNFKADPERGLTLDQVKEYQKKYGPNGKLSARGIPFNARPVSVIRQRDESKSNVIDRQTINRPDRVNPLFVIGWGTLLSARSDAFVREEIQDIIKNIL